MFANSRDETPSALSFALPHPATSPTEPVFGRISEVRGSSDLIIVEDLPGPRLISTHTTMTIVLDASAVSRVAEDASPVGL